MLDLSAAEAIVDGKDAAEHAGLTYVSDEKAGHPAQAVCQGFSLRKRQGRQHQRPRHAEADQGTSGASGLDRCLDLSEGQRPYTGDRTRRNAVASSIAITPDSERRAIARSTIACWRSLRACRPFVAAYKRLWDCAGCRERRCWQLWCTCWKPRLFEWAAFRMAERLGTVDQLRPRWTKEQIASRRGRLAETIEKSGSWTELTRALANDGITLERKGQGIVLGNATGTMKLSDLKKDIRLKPLEARFGQTWAEYEHARDQEPAIEPAMKQDDDDGAEAQTNAVPHQKPQQSTPAIETPSASPEEPPLATTPQKPKVEGEEATGASASSSPKPRKIKLPPVAGASEATETAQQGLSPKIVQRDAASEEPEQPAQVEPDEPRMDPAEFVTKWQAHVKKVEEREAIKLEAEAPRMDPAEFAAKWQAKVKMLEEREAEKKRQAELELKKKMAETERQRERDTRLLARAKARQTTSLTLPALEKPRQPIKKTSALGPNEAALAFEAKQKADDEADFAYRLYGMGVIDRKQLAHPVRQKAQADADTDKHRQPGKVLERELRKALTPNNHKAEQRPKKEKGPEKKKARKMSR